MTVVQPNSIAGINSISVQSGQSLSIHKSDGTLIREIVASTGISTYSSISVGSATTTNNAAKSINIGLGASISQHADNSLSFGTNGDERARIDSTGRVLVGTTAGWGSDVKLHLASSGNTYATITSGTSHNGVLAFSDDGSERGSIDYDHNGDHMLFKTAASEALRIDSANKVGIGTDAISGKLEVYNGVSKINALTLRTGAGANGYAGLAFASNQTYSREKAAIYFQETSGGAHHAGDIVIAVDSAGGDAGQVATSDEKVRITSAGNFLVGKNSVYGSAIAQVHNTSQYVLDLNVWSADANPAVLAFYKSRNATPGGATVVQDDDGIGSLRFLGNDGANSREAAYIKAFVDGAPGTNDMPGRLVFGTTADGGSSSTERLQILSTGEVRIGSNSTAASTAGDDLVIEGSSDRGISIISGSSSSSNIYFGDSSDADIGRIAYQQTDNAFDFSTNAGGTRLRLDGDGRIIFKCDSTGGSSALGGFGTHTWTPKVQVLHDQGQVIIRDGDEVWGGALHIAKCRGTYASPSAAAQNDRAGGLYYHAHDGTDFLNYVAGIETYLDGAVAGNDTPGRLVFSTAADAANTLTERLRIDSAGLMTQTGQTRISQSSTHSHGLNAGTVFEVRGDKIGDGATDVDYFKGFKLALNDQTEWGSQAQFSVGRWEENGNNARSSFVLSLGHGQINSATNADVDVFTCHSNGRMYVGHTGNNAGSNGRFYVTSSGASESTCDLHHSTNDNSNCLNLIHGGAGVNGNPTRVMVEFRNFANNAIATIQSNSTTITYNTGSDYRMKENQVDISDGITKVKQLKPYRFNWKSEYGGGDKVDGFFAHEAATVVPEAVQGTKDAVDSNGDIIRQQIDHSKLVPLLTAALKEAIAKIETLETKVAALESS